MELSPVVYAEGSAGPDNLMHRVPQLDLDVLSPASNPDISITQFSQKIQGRPGLLAQSNLKGVLRTTLTNRFFHVTGHSVKSIRRTSAVYALVRTLMIVIADPVIEPLACVRKRSEHRIGKELRPYGLPEPLDLAKGHGMVGS